MVGSRVLSAKVDEDVRFAGQFFLRQSIIDGH
jgi:hypothetical protein